MSEVVNFPGITYADIPPDDVLNAAMGNLSGVIVIGVNADGNEYFASSYSDGAQILWLIERFKARLLGEIDD